MKRKRTQLETEVDKLLAIANDAKQSTVVRAEAVERVKQIAPDLKLYIEQNGVQWIVDMRASLERLYEKAVS